MTPPTTGGRPGRAVRTGRVVGGWALGLAVALGAAACTGAAGPPGPATSAAPAAPVAPDATSSGPTATSTLPPDRLAGLAVEIRQSRADWGDRVVQVRVRNDTGEPLVVAGATLRTPRVEGEAASDPARSREVPVGSHRDFSVALGAPVCPGTVGDAVVELEVLDGAGRRGRTSTVPADPQGHLDRIHREDCAAAAVSAGVEIGIGPTVTVHDRAGVPTAAVDLVVRPVEGGPAVAITAVERTNLLTPTSGAVWTDPALADLGPDGAVVPLEFRQARCDPHAVAEDKRGTFFGVHASVAGVAQPVFYVGVDDAVRAQVYAYIGRACGWSG